MNANPIASTDLVLFDIDGVVADDSHRVEFAVRKLWGPYFELIGQDTPLQRGFELAWKYANTAGTEVQYLTGRRVDLYQGTSTWLRDHGFPNPESITMRGFAHRNILAKYKESVFRSALESGRYRSIVLFEDDPAVVDHLNATFGEGSAVLCDWYVKNPEMVKYAQA